MITSASDPVYANAGGTAIRCTVTLRDETGAHSYLALDGDATSQALYDALKAGQFGAVAAYVAPVTPAPTTPELRAYANAKADALRAGVRHYTLEAGLVVYCDATQGTGIDLQALMVWGAANGSATINFVQNDGGVVTLAGAQCVALASAVVAYGQSLFAMLALAMNGVSNGTITMTAQIDALSWPA